MAKSSYKFLVKLQLFVFWQSNFQMQCHLQFSEKLTGEKWELVFANDFKP
jgi:hypothetical protein